MLLVSLGYQEICSFIGLFLTVISFFFSLRILLKGLKFHYYYLNLLFLFLFSIYILLNVLSGYFSSLNLFYSAFFILFLADFTLIFKAEILIHEKAKNWKVAFFAGFCVFGFMNFLAHPIEFATNNAGNGQIIFDFQVMIPSMIPLVFSSINYLYYILMIFQKSPQSVKKYARLYLLGMIIAMLSFSMLLINPGFLWLSNLIMGLGILLVSFSVLKEPKLLFILRFKVYQLTMINTTSGIELFTFHWKTKHQFADSILFSGMIQGVNTIIREALKKGEVNEIHLTDGILLLNRSHDSPVACILIASNSTPALEECFSLFANKFFIKYQGNFVDVVEVSIFQNAGEIVKECFPIIPIYDE